MLLYGLLLINGICIYYLIIQVGIMNRLRHYFKWFYRKADTIDWKRTFPLAGGIRRILKKYIHYSSDLDKTHLSIEDKIVFHVLWSIVVPFCVVILCLFMKGQYLIFCC